MGVQTADRDWSHLYPPFREKLGSVLAEVSRSLGEDWFISEGLRSPERQSWLWSQGRTRPGKIVTWMRSPKWHGTGLAADCLPKRKGYGAPMTWWRKFRDIYHRHGLENPAWGNGDLGHLQLSDSRLRAKALVWVRAGCPAGTAPSSELRAPSPDHILVRVNGLEVEDADAYLEENRAWVKLQPVTDALDLVIAEVTRKGKERLALVVNDERDFRIDVVLKEGRAFARASSLPARCDWNGLSNTLTIKGDGGI